MKMSSITQQGEFLQPRFILTLNGPIPEKVKALKAFIKKCENKNLTQFLFHYSIQKSTGL